MTSRNEVNELTYLFGNIKLTKPNEIKLLEIELNKINMLINKINTIKKRTVISMIDHITIINTENMLQTLINKWDEEQQLQNEQQEDNVYDYYQSI